ncbi:hypothetical protein BK754_27270 [Bacillus thuringiensis serovar subtoxicus]|uniref:Uncharacterized protein n=3 Tax=Bacillus cereus group TaxID=86661 RepID=A0A9W5R7Q9_BACCE|nr:hypothetical protein IKC_03429 [Bacillus cereus VD184]OTY86312.1 hypothetical protein BK754_27270 [Bacillus thuringiensis serovar subtoxicus]
MRKYFGFISMFLTIIVFFNFYSDSNLIYLIFVSLVLIIFAPKGIGRNFAIIVFILVSIFYPFFSIIIATIIGAMFEAS